MLLLEYRGIMEPEMRGQIKVEGRDERMDKRNG